MLIQALFPQSAVEALDVSVLHRFDGPDELQFYAVLVRSSVERLADELRAGIHLNQVGAPSSSPQLFKHPRHADTRQREVDLDVRTLPVPLAMMVNIRMRRPCTGALATKSIAQLSSAPLGVGMTTRK
ncbi:hypothetical protein [Burkholderia sp. SCN-KJ]|uniref:hypothetical protein n=1 Tax=Burkholderia sp. SCN-KJ TaxID=2969248 RepID=UPI00215055FB|nr:hypothetical protein [Burkholderia sp. SCN-KJ]MCR4470035.1 hypothetical protein [Burkholderia sp. SCN-KJ]